MTDRLHDIIRGMPFEVRHLQARMGYDNRAHLIRVDVARKRVGIPHKTVAVIRWGM